MIIDSHAHIYQPEFEDDIDEVIQNAKAVGISAIYMPNIDSSTIHRMENLEIKHPMCKSMMGIHPCYIKENYLEELAIVKQKLEQKKYVGVGEIGIDLYWDKSFADAQFEAFRYQIELAKEHEIPFVIHSRDALEHTISIVEEMQDGNLRGIFHCFNGTVEEGKRIVDLGFYMGIGGVVTYKNAGVDKVVEQLPIEAMVLETDAPYLSPGPKRSKRNEPKFITKVVDKLVEIKGMTKDNIEKVTSENCKKIFKD